MSGPLSISSLQIPGGGTIGLVHCPGRNHTDDQGEQWQRNLGEDLEAIKKWRAQILITLIEEHEYITLGVSEFESQVRLHPYSWCHMPIKDMGTPGKVFFNAWSSYGSDVLRRIEQGGRVVVHCAAGLGRTGMIAAKMMVAMGVSPEKAILQVRDVRPGAIETCEQEEYVMNGQAL